MTTNKTPSEHLQIVRDALCVARDNAYDTNEAAYYADALPSLEALGKAFEWQPIETLHLDKFNGYAVSKSVLLSICFDETGITNIKSGRVWEESGKRSLPDNKHDIYERVTHWMPLPQPPKAKE